MNASRLVAVALVAFACSKPIDVERRNQAVANVVYRAQSTLTLCQIAPESPCDRSGYDTAFRELQDVVLGDPKRKAAVEDFGVVFETVIQGIFPGAAGETTITYKARQAANADKLTEASGRLSVAMKAS